MSILAEIWGSIRAAFRCCRRALDDEIDDRIAAHESQHDLARNPPPIIINIHNEQRCERGLKISNSLPLKKRAT